MTFDPKQAQFVPRAGKARSEERHWRAKPGTFDEKVERLELRFDRLLDMPIVQAMLLVISCVAVIGTIAALLGWRP